MALFFFSVVAGVSICSAHGTRIHVIAFPLARMARDARLSRALALSESSRHDSVLREVVRWLWQFGGIK